MIFVVLGTQKFPMVRLLSQIDALIEEDPSFPPVVAQIGHTEYTPKHFTCQAFMEPEAFRQAIADCRLLITHSGVGTIMTGLQYGKPIIVVPRLSARGEHVDDHQLEIAKAFAQQELVLMQEEDMPLSQLILQAQTFPFRRYSSNREQVLDTLRNYLSSL